MDIGHARQNGAGRDDTHARDGDKPRSIGIFAASFTHLGFHRVDLLG
jgi:hypothetical protein